jgi:hypothetical protein
MVRPRKELSGSCSALDCGYHLASPFSKIQLLYLDFSAPISCSHLVTNTLFYYTQCVFSRIGVATDLVRPARQFGLSPDLDHTEAQFADGACRDDAEGLSRRACYKLAAKQNHSGGLYGYVAYLDQGHDIVQKFRKAPLPF